jgi:hypothetical protein
MRVCRLERRILNRTAVAFKAGTVLTTAVTAIVAMLAGNVPRPASNARRPRDTPAVSDAIALMADASRTSRKCRITRNAD